MVVAKMELDGGIESSFEGPWSNGDEVVMKSRIEIHSREGG